MNCFLLADDNPDLRSALRLMLETRLAAPLIFEAADYATVIDRIPTYAPECLILDWELPGLDDHRCLAVLCDRLPGLKIIVISARPEVAEAAALAYADVFVCQTDPPSEILNAIQRLTGGD